MTDIRSHFFGIRYLNAAGACWWTNHGKLKTVWWSRNILHEYIKGSWIKKAFKNTVFVGTSNIIAWLWFSWSIRVNTIQFLKIIYWIEHVRSQQLSIHKILKINRKTNTCYSFVLKVNSKNWNSMKPGVLSVLQSTRVVLKVMPPNF